MAEPKKPFHELIADKLIAQLQEGTAPWQKPWDGSSVFPTNHISGKRYKGINLLRLMAEGRSDNRWMTYRQASSVGAQVEKGEKATSIQYWKFFDERTKLDEKKKPVRDAEGNLIKEFIKLERPKVFYASVFNAEQISGLPELEVKERTWNTVERAESILKESGADIRHMHSDRAFYSPSKDYIQLPEKQQFANEIGYYGVALHELGHWTGHASRLDRDLSHPFGSEGYAKEELRAEIASMIIGEELGVGNDTNRNASYVKSWVKVLKDDPFEIIRAAGDAEKVSEFVLAFENQQEQEQEQFDRVKEVDEKEKEVLSARSNDARVMNDEGSTGADISVAKSRVQVAESIAERSRDAERAESTAPDIGNQTVALSDSRTNIDVPFAEKEDAKAAGARWDRQEKTWYVPPNVALNAFSRWREGAQLQPKEIEETSASISNRGQKTYLAVPYRDRVAAKSAGAKWDKSAKSWYADSGADMDRLKGWLPEAVDHEQSPAMMPRDEFSDSLRALGCVVDGDHPIMDGSKQRIAVDGDRRGETAGFYVGHLDGHPAGYIKNNRTGEELRWKSKGYTLGAEEKAKLQAVAAEKLADRAAAQERLQEDCSVSVRAQAAKLMNATKPTAYLKNKGLDAKPGILTDEAGKITYIPAFDVEGKHWTTQTVYEDGTKRFAKNGKKEGCFHVVGGMSAIAEAPVLIISEGYATASTVSNAVGFASIAAFDSGNLKKVSEALHDKYPDKPLIIFGDDDRQLELTQGVNVGKVKAIEAAESVGGKAVFPIFAPGEAEYPGNMAAVTPETYKNHLQALRDIESAPESEKEDLKKNILGSDQLSALARMKKYTDFNDLLSNSELGAKAVIRQVKNGSEKVIEEALTRQKSKLAEKQSLEKLEIGQRKRISRVG